MASALDETGLFSSTQHLPKFAQTVALGGMRSMIKLAERLELTFMVEVTYIQRGALSTYLRTTSYAPGTSLCGVG